MKTFKVTRQISATEFKDSTIEAETEKEAWDKANLYPFGIVTKITPVKSATIAQIENTVALEYGKLAFAKGIMCVPVADPNLMNMMEGRKVGTSVNILKAWIKGWTIENLKD